MLKLNLCSNKIDQQNYFLFLSGDESNSDEEEESMSEGEMAKLMEEVEEKKKLIANIRNKPWRMRRRLKVLKYCLILNVIKLFNESVRLTTQHKTKFIMQHGHVLLIF